jgi:hypothetical protein
MASYHQQVNALFELFKSINVPANGRKTGLSDERRLLSYC